MVRAPANLRIVRNAPGSGIRGPPLGGRSRGSKEAGPKRRATGVKTKSRKANTDVKIEDTLSDGMVQQLLRLQRKEWDPVPYEPKYAHGSKEALDLIEAGKKLFEGEVPTVKVPGPLEKRLGIVGMHGA